MCTYVATTAPTALPTDTPPPTPPPPSPPNTLEDPGVVAGIVLGGVTAVGGFGKWYYDNVHTKGKNAASSLFGSKPQSNFPEITTV
tara:strand:- start:1168 stop:1425 length:258 start_codon:yes stop_codon:yes gene_type:complete